MPDEPKILPPDAPEVERLNALFAIARDIRGNFIDQAIWIDVLITDILAQYFVPDEGKRRLLSSDVLAGPDASFSGRIDILRKVVFRSYVTFKEEYPDLFDKLDKIRRFRNRLAHARLDTRTEFVAKGHEDRIQIVFDEDGTTKTQIITVGENKNRLAECTAVVLQLVKLQALVQSSGLSILEGDNHDGYPRERVGASGVRSRAAGRTWSLLTDHHLWGRLMNLHEFVKETLVQIVRGIQDANASLDPDEPKANQAFLLEYSGGEPQTGPHIEFDVAVTTQLEATGQAEGKAQLLVATIALDGSGSVSRENTSRVKFSVLIKTPQG
jgi:hypothetical protein